MIEVQGHRGSKGTHKENTLSAFKEAIEAGCIGVELDLRMSKEQEIIIHHDPDIENKSIDSLTLKELKKIDQDLLTLEELFQFSKKKIEYNLEIKWDISSFERGEFAKKIVDLVEKNGVKKKVAYSSFDEKVLFEVQKLEKNAKIGFLNDKSLDDLYKIGSCLQAAVLSPHHSLLIKKEDVERLQKTGARVIPWTVDQIDRLQELVKMGVNGIITNYPRKFIEYLKCA
jgi:glycerophosphoryl diester phosphodiesterase